MTTDPASSARARGFGITADETRTAAMRKRVMSKRSTSTVTKRDVSAQAGCDLYASAMMYSTVKKTASGRSSAVLVISSSAALAACASIDIESMRFRCGGDDQCIDGWVCDQVIGECVRA